MTNHLDLKVVLRFLVFSLCLCLPLISSAADRAYQKYFPTDDELPGWKRSSIKPDDIWRSERGRILDKLEVSYRRTKPDPKILSMKMSISRAAGPGNAKSLFEFLRRQAGKANTSTRGITVEGTPGYAFYYNISRGGHVMNLVFPHRQYVAVVELVFRAKKLDWSQGMHYAGLLKRKMSGQSITTPGGGAANAGGDTTKSPLDRFLPTEKEMPWWGRRTYSTKLGHPYNKPQNGVRVQRGLYTWWVSKTPTSNGPARMQLYLLEFSDPSAAAKFLSARLAHWRSWQKVVRTVNGVPVPTLYDSDVRSHSRTFVRVGRVLAIAFITIPQGEEASRRTLGAAWALAKRLKKEQDSPPQEGEGPSAGPAGRLEDRLPLEVLPRPQSLGDWHRTLVQTPPLPALKGIKPDKGIIALYRWAKGGNLPVLKIKVWGFRDTAQANTYFEEYRWQWAKRPGRARRSSLRGSPAFIYVSDGPPRNIAQGFQVGRYVAEVAVLSHRPPLGEKYTNTMALIELERLAGGDMKPQPPASGPIKLIMDQPRISMNAGQYVSLPVTITNTSSRAVGQVELRVWTTQRSKLCFSQSRGVRGRSFLIKRFESIGPKQTIKAESILIKALAAYGKAVIQVSTYPGGRVQSLEVSLSPGQILQSEKDLHVTARSDEIRLAKGEEIDLPFVIRNLSARTMKGLKVHISTNSLERAGLAPSERAMPEQWLQRTADLAPGQTWRLSPWRLIGRANQGQAVITLVATPDRQSPLKPRTAQVRVNLYKPADPQSPDEEAARRFFGSDASLLSVWQGSGGRFLSRGVVEPLTSKLYFARSRAVTYPDDHKQWAKLMQAVQKARDALVDKVSGDVKQDLVVAVAGQTAGQLVKFKSAVETILNPKATEEEIISTVATWQVPSSAEIYYRVIKLADRMGALLRYEEGMAAGAARFKAKAGVLIRKGLADERGLLVKGKDGRNYFIPFKDG